MARDRLEIPIDFDLAAARATLAQAKKDAQFFSNNLKAAGTQADKVNLAQTQVANTLNAIAKMSDNGIKRIFVAGAEGIKAIDLESLKIEAIATIEAMNTAWDSQGQRIANIMDGINQLNQKIIQPAAAQAIDRLSESATSVSDSLADVNAELQTTIDQVDSIPDLPALPPPINMPPPAVAAAGPTAIFSAATMAAVASRGLAVAMGVAAVASSAVSRAASNVKATIDEARTSFDLFRAAQNAPVVDPTANFRKQDLQERAAMELDRIEKHRATRDAEISGYKATAQAAAASADGIANANARAAASATKHEWANRQASGSINLLRTAFAPIGGLVQSVADEYGGLNPKLAETAEESRRVAAQSRDAAAAAARQAFVLTGELDRASATTEQYGHVIRAAGLGQRFMVREMEGGQRVIGRTMSVVSAITTPLRSMRAATERNRDEWRQLYQLLGQEPPSGPGMLSRAFRATASASSSMATTIGQSSLRASRAIAGTAVVRHEIEYQRRQFAELKEDFRPLFQPLLNGVAVAKATLTGLSEDIGDRLVSGVAQGRAALIRFGQLEPVQRGMQAAGRAARAIGSGAEWAAPKLTALGGGLLTGVGKAARWTQSLKMGQAAQSAIAKSMLFVHQRTRWLHPTFGLVTGSVGKLFSRFRSAQPATQAVAQATAAVGQAAAAATPNMEGLAQASSQVQQAMQQTTPAAEQAGQAIRRAAPSGGGGGFGGFLKGAIASKLAVGALAMAVGSWGASNAIATETATVKFGTLLQDMDQGKALIQEITGFSAVTPFSNEALRESAGLLLAAQVPADQITNRLQMLGDIAAGTSKPVGEITAVFQKMASTGKVQQDNLNQLAERGVPIYDALQQQLGVTRSEMLKMVGSGKVGFDDMDAALQSLTASGGVFAGGMAAQSQTAAGLWSTLKDNVGIAFETLMTGAVESMKPVMEIGISLAQSLTAGLEKVKPVGAAVFGALKAYVMGMWNLTTQVWSTIASVAQSAFAAIGLSGETTFGDLIGGLVVLFTQVQYTFENFPLAAVIAFDSTILAFIQMGESIGHFFTSSMPAYINWFSENWANMFMTAANFVGTFATNITKNITDAWGAIWDYITGKSDSLNFDWTPLTEGFRNEVAKLPDIPERAVTEIEVQMSADIAAMKEQFSKGADEAVAKALESMAPAAKVELKPTTAADTRIEEGDTADGKSKDKGMVATTLERDSAETLRAIFNAQSNKQAEKSLKAQERSAKATEELVGIMRPMASRQSEPALEAF